MNSEFDKITELMADRERYRKAYHILMEYWDCIPEDEREELNKKLKAVGC